MTLSPFDSPMVRGVAGPDYKVGPRCANPACRRWTDHAHHIFRRSQLGGVFAWVEIKGVAYQNLCGLCASCHDDVTGRVGGHRAAIRLLGPDYDWTWAWCVVHDGEVKPAGPIDPQPLALEMFASSQASGQPELETCPTCGHVKRARSARTQGRARKSWTILVPADAENGADILDTLVDDMALILGVESNQTGRYFVVMPCLYYAHQEKSRFVESLKGVGG